MDTVPKLRSILFIIGAVKMVSAKMMHVLNNVFLPRRLPQEDLESALNPGGGFVQLVAREVVDLAKEVPLLEFEEVARMMKRWMEVQHEFVSWEKIHNNITNLLPGETFALYVRGQNAGVCISMPVARADLATMAVFRVAASSKEVMEAPGDLISIFPSWTVKTDVERVRSESFAKQVAEMANTMFPETLPKSTKARDKVVETRDVADASYMTTWLVLAVAGRSKISAGDDTARVEKKIRDDILWDNAAQPWRRSGEYMTVKVVLQSTLQHRLGSSNGRISYKLALIQVMTNFLQRNYMQLETDLVLQMLSKLARRLSKVDLVLQSDPVLPGILTKGQEILKTCSNVVVTIRGFIDERWQKIIKREASQSQVVVDTSKLNFAEHIKHSLNNATQHLEQALTASPHPAPIKVRDPICCTRNKSKTIPDVGVLDSNKTLVDIGEALYDIESWVQNVLWAQRKAPNIHLVSHSLFNLFRAYIKKGKEYYGDDPVGSSRMILATITIVAVLDYTATREHPLLQTYNHGVNTSVLQQLLLPHRGDMEHLAELEAYFASRVRNLPHGSSDISLISDDIPSIMSFSVQYASQDRAMQKIKAEIIEFGAQKEREKLEEVSQRRRDHELLLQSARGRSHTQTTDRYGYESHAYWGCTKCNLTRQAENMTVSIYESPFPAMDHLQSAVVYELATPIKLIILRDALHVLNKEVLGVELASNDKKGTWLEYEPLKKWVPSAGAYSRVTTLCSISKLFLQTHYNVPLHVSNPNHDFIKPNGYNVHLMETQSSACASTSTYVKAGDISSLVTLGVHGVYECLQWTMGGTTHTENQVLARQNPCPLELNLSEFKAFGALRAGHLLQVRNIARVLEMQSLSFGQPSVVNLLAQSLWQTGPPIVGGHLDEWVRESHLDLRDEAFVGYVIKQLDSLLERNRENWKDHLVLLSIVTLTRRLLELSEGTWNKAIADVLLSCRGVAECWLERIEQVLGEMLASPIEEVRRIRGKLVEIAAIAALTFDVKGRHVSLVLRNEADVTSWLLAMSRINDNILLNSMSTSRGFQHVFRQNLLRQVWNVALCLEASLNQWLSHDNCLNDFVLKHWADARQGWFGSWAQYDSPCERWWRCTFTILYADGSERNMNLQMDTLRGSFLVDGCPVARLPSTISDHEDYKRVFGMHVFQVQPAATCSGSFVSLYKLKGSTFTFALLNNNRLLVRERHHDGYELELFPSRFLEDDLPLLLTRQHSHWILREGNDAELKRSKHMDPRETRGCILFRPVKFDNPGFTDIEGVPFVLNIALKLVRDVKRHRSLVDVGSTSVRELHNKVLHRLELKDFIHVFVDEDDMVVAEIPRMGLNFNVDPKSGEFWSWEQPGFLVSKEQSFGTLIGLHCGLVLEENKSSGPCTPKRNMIIPHFVGLLSSNMGGTNFENHHVVKINFDKLCSPSFFIYEIDDRMRCLRGPASPTAWLYLALLHAMTSYLLPDPFTGLTGTESAMRLLQSPRCWTCEPYKIEAHSILKAIAKLSPTRTWYPKHLQCMQTVTWPATMYSSTSLDAFQLVVVKLIANSERLKFLFPISVELDPLPSQEDLKLSLKYYWRCREIFGEEAQMNAEMEQSFGGPPGLSVTDMNLSTKELDVFKKHVFARNLAEAGHTWRHVLISQKEGFLKSHLLNCSKLAGVSIEDFSENPTISAWRGINGSNFSQCFLNLYNFARLAQEQDRCKEFTFFLAFLAYSSVHPRPLSALHCVAIHAREFKSLKPPAHESYECTSEANFNMDMVSLVVNNHKKSVEDWMSKDGRKPQLHESRDHFIARKKMEFQRIQATEYDAISTTARECWPAKFRYYGSSKTIDSHLACKEINDLFERWRHNKELHDFVARVEEKISNICYEPTCVVEPGPLQAPINLRMGGNEQPFRMVTSSPHVSGALLDSLANRLVFRSGTFGPSISTCEPTRPNCKPLPPFPLQKADISSEIAKKFNNDMIRSWNEHHKFQPRPPIVVEKEQIEEKLRVCKAKSTALWQQICDVLKPWDVVGQALEAAGLWRRVVPVKLLPFIMRGELENTTSESLRVGLGALAVLWTLEQQAERCLRMLHLNKSPKENIALQKELANVGHSNWRPEDHPEWLLLELEGDYLMRTVQVDVANKMLCPDGNENVVLQLNMGEGKTSVIVPALCASISDGVQFARVTVLNSLFRMNFDALAFKLGGLLNQRVYTFPYRRDLKFSNSEVRIMKEVYEECVAKRGVVVMRPEHRLSFELKVLELCRSGNNPSLAAQSRNLQNMVNTKARDVLDESDLLLHVKYQVVYTVGEQMNLDGGTLRWKVSQSVLQSAQRHCESLLQKFGSEAIEFKRANEEPFAFPHMRLLRGVINNDLCKMIADDILSGGDDNLPIRELRHDVAGKVRSFILPESINVADVSLEGIEDICPIGPILDCILILRGLLCYGVLFHALQMRWRVQYGVRPSRIPKMAVPFRAKDVPVERAEYGHPDVAIMLTQISYYNSGLSDKQLLESFHRLHRLSTSESEYQRWLKDVPCERVPKTMRTLSTVNLEDFVQRTTVVFPFLRRNMRVIDFWLSTVVFPVEAKQFEGKLVASAWDLSNVSKEGRPISGFSGTKDTSLLLPASIIQRDLPELQGTDGAMIKKLLQHENSSYHEFPSCITSLQILERIVESRTCVLLDVGALMVDMGNRDVATKWLEKLVNRQEIEAAIYFDDDNQVTAIDRSGRSGPLHLSPFREQMSRCVVYLDDVHTRGTDLKIPYGSHACVTLGQGITKDRLMQACMRMRMLGEGHSVSFWASQEVHASIVSTLPSSVKPTSIDVLHWVMKNTVIEIQHGFRHWGSQGIAHACKQVIFNKFESKQGVHSLQQLGQLCMEKEITALSRSYGCERKLRPLPSIVNDRLQRTANNMQGAKIGQDTCSLVLELGHSVTNKINRYTRGVKCFAQVLDEEQERELEHELEEYQEVQRPNEATPHKPRISKVVRQLATYGHFNRTSTEFLPMLEAFKGTRLWQKAEPSAWSSKLFVTREFATVVTPDSASSGVDFVRPVAWLVVVTSRLGKDSKPESSYMRNETHYDLMADLEAIILLSPFEVNALMAEFRQGHGAHLHMVAPRNHRGQSFMVSEPSLVLPKLGNKSKPLDDPAHIAQLLGFSGSVFFATGLEQDAYCEFLGLCPRPRSGVEENAFHRGDIQQDGYVPPEQRQKLGLKTTCGFEASPVPFMVEVLSTRGWVGHASTSHVGHILFMGRRACIGNVDNPCKVKEF